MIITIMGKLFTGSSLKPTSFCILATMRVNRCSLEILIKRKKLKNVTKVKERWK
nr:hypothetical protein GZ27E7_19 [uncultured archaeon GZfos27E7]